MAAEQPQPQPAQPAPAVTPNATSAPAPVAPAPYAPPVAATSPPPTPRAWHLAKLGLNGAAIVSSIILIALSAAAWAASDGYAFELVWIVPVAGVALCWLVAELITLGARGGLSRSKNNLGRGIHPGAHVGMHLVLWMSFAIDLGIEAFNAYYVDLYYSDTDDSDYLNGYGFDSYYSFLASPLYRGITKALVAFSAISL